MSSTQDSPPAQAAQVDISVSTYCVNSDSVSPKAAPHYAKQRHDELTDTDYDDCHGHVVTTTPDGDYVVAVYDSPVEAVYEVSVPDTSLTALVERDGYIHPHNEVWHTSMSCAGREREVMTFGDAVNRNYSICRLCASDERETLRASRKMRCDDE